MMLALYLRIVDVNHMSYLVNLFEIMLIIHVEICTKNVSVMLVRVFVALTP